MIKTKNVIDIERTSNLYDKYNAIISICNEMSERVGKILNIKKDKLYTLYNPVNIESIKKQMSEKIDLNDQDYLLTVSRLVEGKGLLQLIDIYKELKDLGVKNKLYIIGDGELKEKIQEKIAHLDLKEDCILLGEKSNPYPYFKKAKLFLFTSESEGLGMVIIESIVCGKPVITMNCPTGPKEILGLNNEYGKLIPMHDKNAFINAVLELINDEEKYKYYCIQSIKRSIDFSSSKISQQIDKIFKEITKKYNS